MMSIKDIKTPVTKDLFTVFIADETTYLVCDNTRLKALTGYNTTYEFVNAMNEKMFDDSEIPLDIETMRNDKGVIRVVDTHRFLNETDTYNPKFKLTKTHTALLKKMSVVKAPLTPNFFTDEAYKNNMLFLLGSTQLDLVDEVPKDTRQKVHNLSNNLDDLITLISNREDHFLLSALHFVRVGFKNDDDEVSLIAPINKFLDHAGELIGLLKNIIYVKEQSSADCTKEKYIITEIEYCLVTLEKVVKEHSRIELAQSYTLSNTPLSMYRWLLTLAMIDVMNSTNLNFTKKNELVSFLSALGYDNEYDRGMESLYFAEKVNGVMMNSIINTLKEFNTVLYKNVDEAVEYLHSNEIVNTSYSRYYSNCIKEMIFKLDRLVLMSVNKVSTIKTPYLISQLLSEKLIDNYPFKEVMAIMASDTEVKFKDKLLCEQFYKLRKTPLNKMLLSITPDLLVRLGPSEYNDKEGILHHQSFSIKFCNSFPHNISTGSSHNIMAKMLDVISKNRIANKLDGDFKKFDPVIVELIKYTDDNEFKSIMTMVGLLTYFRIFPVQTLKPLKEFFVNYFKAVNYIKTEDFFEKKITPKEIFEFSIYVADKSFTRNFKVELYDLLGNYYSH